MSEKQLKIYLRIYYVFDDTAQKMNDGIFLNKTLALESSVVVFVNIARIFPANIAIVMGVEIYRLIYAGLRV